MTNLCRFTVDLDSRRVIEHTILARGCQLDHPKVHPRWATRDSRFVFGILGRRDNGGDEDATPLPPQSFGCVDLGAPCDDGEGGLAGAGRLVDVWFAGERRLVDEATLVPMGAGDEADDDDERACWLIADSLGETLLFEGGRARWRQWRKQ